MSHSASNARDAAPATVKRPVGSVLGRTPLMRSSG